MAYPIPDIDPAPRRAAWSFLSGKHGLRAAGSPGDAPVVIQIGDENTLPQLKGSSLIVASCRLHGGNTGHVGIVGPTRMDYSRLAARLSFFAKGLSAGMEDIIKDKDKKDDDDDV